MNHRLVFSSALRVLIFASFFIPGGLSRAVDPGSPVTATPTATGTPATTTSPIPADAPPAPVVPSETPSTGQSLNPSTPAETTTGERPATYTVASGDTLWVIAHKFDTSIRKLKKINHLKKDRLRPGQVLKIPPAHAPSATKKTASTSHRDPDSVAGGPTRHAEPVQNFDLPVSPFASSPAPISAETTAEKTPTPAVESTQPSDTAKSSELTYLSPSGPISSQVAERAFTTATPHASTRPRHSRSSTVAAPRAVAIIPPASSLSAPSLADSPLPPSPSTKSGHGLFNFFYTPPPSVDWGARFTQVARNLGDQGLEYDESWCPPGESHSWSMDCSNTARYLYRVTTGIQLPRTASDQYYYLHLQNKAWDVPQVANGYADCNYLRQNLKPGDLLFWENTYKPDRQPPITHVMIFLGTNTRGQWIMAGSQSTRGGEHNRRHGGPDIYVFNPTRPCGGYSTWLGLVHHRGRFCAFGRPLEADKSKLAVASDG